MCSLSSRDLSISLANKTTTSTTNTIDFISHNSPDKIPWIRPLVETLYGVEEKTFSQRYGVILEVYTRKLLGLYQQALRKMSFRSSLDSLLDTRTFPISYPLYTHGLYEHPCKYRASVDSLDIDTFRCYQQDGIVLRAYTKELGRIYRKARRKLLLHKLLGLQFDLRSDVVGTDSALGQSSNLIDQYHRLRPWPSSHGRLPDTEDPQSSAACGFYSSLNIQRCSEHFQRRFVNGEEAMLPGLYLSRRTGPESDEFDFRDPSTSRMIGTTSISHQGTAGSFSGSKGLTTDRSNSKAKGKPTFARHKFEYNDHPLFYNNPLFKSSIKVNRSRASSFRARLRNKIEEARMGRSPIHEVVTPVKSSETDSHSTGSKTPPTPRKDSTVLGKAASQPQSKQNEGILKLLKSQEKENGRPEPKKIESTMKLLQSVSLSTWTGATIKKEMQQPTKHSKSSSPPIQEVPSSGGTTEVKGMGRMIFTKLCCPNIRKVRQRRGLDAGR